MTYHHHWAWGPSKRRGYIAAWCTDCGGVDHECVRCAYRVSKKRCLNAITNPVPGDPYCAVHQGLAV